MADTLPAGAAAARVGAVRAYHERSKHAFNRFAPGPGALDWATQPDPFRRYAGAPVVELPRSVPTAGAMPVALNLHSLGDCLRCAFGITAWKQAGGSRWALRANPSSGNLHPTEAYLVAPIPTGSGWTVSHYAPKEHALETRAVLQRVTSSPAAPTDAGLTLPEGVCLVGLSSIHWREAWKYGERAFRYCQHDVGHAIGALVYSAARFGWRVRVLDGWGDADIAGLLGLPDAAAANGAEPEHPDCLLAVGPGDVEAANRLDVQAWLTAAGEAAWQGVPNQLSPSHREWPAIAEVAAATERVVHHGDSGPGRGDRAVGSSGGLTPSSDAPVAREWLIRRRSAVAFDGAGMLSRAAFARMVARLQPELPPAAGVEPSPVWSIGGPTHVRLVWFVHRVHGLAPGIYGQPRGPGGFPQMRGAMRDDLLWEPVDGIDGLFLLAPLDARGLARRLSCDQAIASDGYCGLAMLAPLAAALETDGPSVYRRLFWECGLVGQVLYLEAEMAGGRATGIGCFYDDPVHDMLGIDGHALQSLYHFSMGVPIEDSRLTTAPGYSWD